MNLELKDLYLQGKFKIESGWTNQETVKSSITLNSKGITINNCYIGDFFSPKILFYPDRNDNSIWIVTIQLNSLDTSLDYNDLFQNLLSILSLRLITNNKIYYVNCGLPSFSMIRDSLDIWGTMPDYSKVNIGLSNLNRGWLQITQKFNLNEVENIFKLSQNKTTSTELVKLINQALLNAVKAQDKISLYLMLYYILEIIYGTSEFKKIAKDKDLKISDNRAKILKFYLNNELKISYLDNQEENKITEKMLEEIIKTRNDLTHRVDTEKLNQTISKILFPLIQTIVKKINNF